MRLPWPVVLYLLAVVVPLGFEIGTLAMTLLRVMLLILVIPLGVQLFLGRFGRIYVTDVLFVLHIFWTAVALSLNNPASVIEQTGSVGVEFLGGYFVGRAYIRTPEAFAALCRALVLIVCCTFPLALFETVTGRPLILELLRKLPGVWTPGLNGQEPRLGLERVQISFAHPIHYGLFCSVALSLAFVALEPLTTMTRRLATSAVIGFCGFLSLSSGALLAIVLQVGLIGWSLVFKRFPRRWWLLVGFVALAYVVIDLLSNRTPLRVFMSYATFSAHTAYWRAQIFDWGMVNVWANPIFGIGLNDWVRPYYMYSGSMDNFWLVMAVRYGIPGFLAVTLGYMIAVVRVMRRDFGADPVLTAFRRAWVFSFLGLSFTLCTVHVWTNIYSFVFFLLGAGLWMIHVQVAAPEGTGSEPSQTPPASRYSRFPPHTKPSAGAATPVTSRRQRSPA